MLSIEDRFFSKVKYSTGCWEWNAYKNKDRYGVFLKKSKQRILAHRWSYEYFRGPLGKLLCCHECDNPSCVNPFHLFKGTQSENMKDSWAKGRHAESNVTHCPLGHEYTFDNTYVVPRKNSGYITRYCRTCTIRRSKKRYWANKIC